MLQWLERAAAKHENPLFYRKIFLLISEMIWLNPMPHLTCQKSVKKNVQYFHYQSFPNKKWKVIGLITNIIKLFKEFKWHFKLGRWIQELSGMENVDDSLESFQMSGNFC